MLRIPDSFTLAWAAPAVGCLAFWMLERCYSFLFRTLDQISGMNDRFLIPKLQNGTVWQEGSESFKEYYSNFFGADLRYYTIRIHIVASTIVGFIVAFNLWYGMELFLARRTTGKSHGGAIIHKKMGWIMVYVSIINLVTSGYVLFIMGMVPVGFAALFTDVCGWFIMTFSLPLGIYSAQNKNWKLHRICMIWYAGALFVVPLQRFFWMIGIRLLYVAEDFNSGIAEFFGWLFTTTWMAFFTSLGTAAIYAYSDSFVIKDKAKKSK